MKPGSLWWLTITPPPYDEDEGRVVLTRARVGDNAAKLGVRCGLLAYPEVPIFTLLISAFNLPEDVLFPDAMIDRPLDGLDVTNAQRLLADQVGTDLKPN